MYRILAAPKGKMSLVCSSLTYLVMLLTGFETIMHLLISLEPGYYEDGKFGIRTENVMLVKEVDLEVSNFDCQNGFALID